MAKEIIEKARALRKEVPERTVPQIITMLELAGEVEKGQLKQSTMRRHLGPAEKTAPHPLSSAAVSRRLAETTRGRGTVITPFTFRILKTRARTVRSTSWHSSTTTPGT